MTAASEPRAGTLLVRPPEVTAFTPVVPATAPAPAAPPTEPPAHAATVVGEALAGARVEHELLGWAVDAAASPAGARVDLVVAPEDLSLVQAALRPSGFVAVRAAGAARASYLGYDEATGTWTQVDVYGERTALRGDPMTDRGGGRDRADWHAATAGRSMLPWWRRRRPGLVVALLGPDGAGKTTLAESLVREAPLRARRIYMGTNGAAGDALALHQWVRRRRAALGRRGSGVARLALSVLGAALHLVEERYRHALALRHRAQGGVVVLDRCAPELIVGRRRPHARRSLARRLRCWALHAGAPRPDVVLVLDAPAEVLLARKGEHALEQLELMRQACVALQRERPDVVVVLDAGRDAAAVRRTATSLLWRRVVGASAPSTHS